MGSLRIELARAKQRLLHRPVERQDPDPDPADQHLYDPASSYRNAQRSERLLGNAVLLTPAGYGHPSYQKRSQCIENCLSRSSSFIAPFSCRLDKTVLGGIVTNSKLLQRRLDRYLNGYCSRWAPPTDRAFASASPSRSTRSQPVRD